MRQMQCRFEMVEKFREEFCCARSEDLDDH